MKAAAKPADASWLWTLAYGFHEDRRWRSRRAGGGSETSATAPKTDTKLRLGSHWNLVAMCHVWTAPSWQGQTSASQAWSVQPYVRPVCAVHMTAGHNALRGSGPGQNLAFDNALAHVGCPDRRIDRLCITCCSPSQPSHHAGCRHDLVTPPARRVPCSAHPWPSSPMPFLRSCWPARSQRPSLAAAPAKP